MFITAVCVTFLIKLPDGLRKRVYKNYREQSTVFRLKKMDFEITVFWQASVAK